nr:hypothetical protein [Tanacetum cinerariifolium]
MELENQTTTNDVGTLTTIIPGPKTTEKKAQKKNDVKARSMLPMALPNEHLMTFNQYKDANTLFDAIETRFGRNEAAKKTQKTLLNQLRNKSYLDTMSIDDLYNKLKIVKQTVKGTACSILSSQNMAFVSSPSPISTNEVPTTYGVSTASTQSSTASTKVSTANLSDANVYAFLSSQSNGYQLVHKDLEQIHEDDLEEIDLKWQLELLSMRAKSFFQKTRRKSTINGSDTAGFDKSWNQDRFRRTVNVEKAPPKAMVAIDGVGFDWSYMAEDEIPINMALMDFSDSEVYTNSTCSKTCLKSYETLKKQYDDLRIEFTKFEFNLAAYKRGLASVEEQLVFYKKNEVIFCEQIVVPKRDISYRDLEISRLKCEVEKLKKEKESNQLKLENFDQVSKSLDKLIGSQITDKSRKGVGFESYNVVPAPPTGLFSPLKIDLSYSGLEEF